MECYIQRCKKIFFFGFRSFAGDMSNFKHHGEWELISIPVGNPLVFYGCCSQPFTFVIFKVQIQRKPLYYMFNLVFPGMIINALSVLAFLLPPQSGEKVSLSVTVLLTLTVFMLVISESMPTTSDSIPLLGRLYIEHSMPGKCKELIFGHHGQNQATFACTYLRCNIFNISKRKRIFHFTIFN